MASISALLADPPRDRFLSKPGDGLTAHPLDHKLDSGVL
jgi:hypothetical protein